MKRIVLLGCSAAGVKIIEQIRAHDCESEITIISFDGYYPYSRQVFASVIAGEIPFEKVYCRDKDFYEKNNVNVLLDKIISRINIKRRTIFTEDKEQIDYDVLVVGETPENRFPPSIKGTGKAGVFGYKKLKDIDQIVNDLPLKDSIVIQSKSFSGLQAAVAFAKRNKEILLISSQEDFLGKHFSGDMMQWILNRFEELGLRVIRENGISEVLGDKDAKAVRLRSGKVYSAQVVIIGETDEDLRLFLNSDLQMGKKINVDDRYRTNIESIFAVDQVVVQGSSEPITPSLVLEEQGSSVAAAITDQEHAAEVPVLSWDLVIEGLTISALGQTELKHNRTVQQDFDRESGKYEALYFENNCLIGAILVNTENKKGEYLRMISEKGSIEPAGEKPLTDEVISRRDDIEEITSENVSSELVDN